MKTKILLSTTFIFIICALQAQIIHVPGDYTTIQEGINAASDGDTVLVAEDTYYENINFKGKAITVASHYLIEPDSGHINNTIIDGSQSSNPDSASTVMFISGEDTTSIISGFTITGGAGLLVVNIAARIGGGIVCKNSGAKITHNKIIDNAVDHNHIALGGGISAIYDFSVKWVVVRHCTVKSNQCSTNVSSADGGGILISGKAIISDNNIINNHVYSSSGFARGGGLYFEGHNFMPDSVIIDQNLIRDNISESDGQDAFGGGIMIWYSKATITNNTISNNTVLGNGNIFYGGGISICKPYGELEISGNLIAENSIPKDTAHIGVGLHIWSPFNIVNIHDNEFTGNIAPMNGFDGAGGAISITEASDYPVFIERNIFHGNRATNAGGIYLRFATNILISNNIFDDNAANSGGGIVIWQNASTPEYFFEVINNTFVENHAVVNGGAFRLGGEEGEDIVFMNNIFWGNVAGVGNSIINASQSDTIRVFYSNVDPADISGLWAGYGNINEDPMFVDTGDHPYQVNDYSPCIDTGTPDTTGLNLPDIDLAGEVRIFNDRVDMGAYEWNTFVGTEEFESQARKLSGEVWNFPNPFSASTNIAYELQQPSTVQIIIYNYLGKQIEVFQQKKSAGKQQVLWDAEGYPDGIYYFRLQAGEKVATGKLVKMK